MKQQVDVTRLKKGLTTSQPFEAGGS